MHDRMGEPNRRRRTPRACEACRRRKIRCNGNEVCDGCQASALMCVYRDTDGGRMVKEHIQQFDSRLQRMEGVLAGFMEKLEAMHSQSHGESPSQNPPTSTSVIPTRVVPTRVVPEEEEEERSDDAELAIIAAPRGRSPSKRTAEADRMEDPRPDPPSGPPPSKRRRHELPLPPPPPPRPTYADGYGELHADEWGQLRYIGMSSTMCVIDICMPFRKHINRGIERKGYGHHNNFLGPAQAVCEAVTMQLAADGSEGAATAAATAAAASDDGRRSSVGGGHTGGESPQSSSPPSPSSSSSSSSSTRLFVYGQLPPPPLIDMLVQCFYERMYAILPVIARADLEAQLAELTVATAASEDRHHHHHHHHHQSDFLPVLYGLLAVAALNLPAASLRGDDHPAAVWAPYRDVDLGAGFFALSSAGAHTTHTNGHASGHGVVGNRPPRPYPRRSLNPIIALVLQAEYLAAVGSQAEAWISIGYAARLGQDLGLHRSAGQLGFPRAEQEQRRYVWWCIYSLDRTLSAALGRPVAIHDADGDMELPHSSGSGSSHGSGAQSGGGGGGGGGDGGHDFSGFSAILNLRRILGDIVTTVASVRTVKASRHVSKTREVQAIVDGLNAELQRWATSEVPESIKAAPAAPAALAQDAGPGRQRAVEKFIALSGHFGALLLLYRFFISNPHRPSPLRGNEALVQCARAATHCIRITDKMVPLMPVCADLVLHVQHVFTSSVVLLQCIRRSDDAAFIQAALHDVEQATHCLRRLQPQWPGATRLLAQVEEYVEFTLRFIEDGVGGAKRCAFHHDKSEFTGLEIRDGSARFPPDWAQLACKPLPTMVSSSSSSNSHSHNHSHSHSNNHSNSNRSSRSSSSSQPATTTPLSSAAHSHPYRQTTAPGPAPDPASSRPAGHHRASLLLPTRPTEDPSSSSTMGTAHLAEAPTLFRFALPPQLPQQQQPQPPPPPQPLQRLSLPSTGPATTTGTTTSVIVNDNTFISTPKLQPAVPVPPPKAGQQTGYCVSCHEDAAMRSWSGADIGGADSLSESFWVGDMDGNRFLHDAALLTDDALWGLQ